MSIKQLLLRCVLSIEMITLLHMYFFGTHGLQKLYAQKRNMNEIYSTVTQLQSEISELEYDIIEWKTDFFYKEKIAREQLQMARKDDTLFFIEHYDSKEKL